MSPTLDLETLVLEHGQHDSPEDGMCLMEAVAFLAGEDFSDAPGCVSGVIRSYCIALNDRWDAEHRQLLKPYIPRVIGTNTGPADEERRRWLAVDWAVHEFAPYWLRRAGLVEHAEAFEALAAIASRDDYQAVVQVVRAGRDAAWAKRSASREALRETVREKVKTELAKRPAGAGAVAGAVAVAVAAAAAGAAAAADAVAAAAADAAAAAAAAAAAGAVAVAVAAAAAAAGAAAVAAADAVAGLSYSAAYNAAYPIFKAAYEEAFAEMGDGIRASSLQLLDRLIEVGKVESGEPAEPAV